MGEFVSVTGQSAVLRELDLYAPQARQNLERRAVRAGANVVKKQMSFEADAPGHPHSFTKVKVRISSSMRSGGVPSALVRPSSPLFNIFEPGAHGHAIAPGSKGAAPERGPSRLTRAGTEMKHRYATRGHKTGRRALAGRAGGSDWPADHSQAGRDRDSAFFSTGPVRHPGMSPRSILPATLKASAAEAQRVMAELIMNPAGAL